MLFQERVQELYFLLNSVGRTYACNLFGFFNSSTVLKYCACDVLNS
jgi:hypothetical protein